jgi:hypothetical protein
VTASPIAAILDRRFAAWAIAWAAAALIGFGLASAIIPNPVFGRQIPPEPFAIAIWLVSAPLMGVIAATYMVGPATSEPVVMSATGAPLPVASGEPRSTTLGTIAGLGAFIAIGCPVCNKIALVLLGTSGALTVFGPLQPLIGVASLLLLATTLVWRMRLWQRGAACPTARG